MTDRQFLVVIETQRVKGYLFASRILRETRGGSLLLDRLNRSRTKAILKGTSGEEVYLGGGSGRVLFGTKGEAEAFTDKVRELYSQETANARVSVEVVERRGQEAFPFWVARGVRESQHNKLARTEALAVVAGRWVQPCSSCGKNPSHEVTADIQGIHYLCSSCLYKREEVASFYHNVKRNWDISIPLPSLHRLRAEWPDFILTTLSEKMRDNFGAEVKTLLPQDFDQIAERSTPRNYIGFIYADGNCMGETVKNIGKDFPDDKAAQQAYAAFSSIVDQATPEAAVQAVLEQVGTCGTTTAREEPARFVPAEFVLAGGDDLILVVPAHASLPVASRFISLFQERSNELQNEWVQEGKLSARFAPEGLTISAGVLLAHASFPASHLIDLAGELMKSAKRKAADLAKNTIEGTLDFMVLHEGGSKPLKECRKTEYTRMINNRTVRLTERPYTATETFSLLDRIRAMKNSDVPRTKLKALYSVIFQSVMQAQFDALSILARLKATGDLGRSTALSQLLQELPLFPFRENEQGDWTTPLSELIEIYDFVPANNTSPARENTHG